MRNITGAISVVIVTFRRPAMLRYGLEKLKQQTVQPDHILIVDDHSADETATVVADAAIPFLEYMCLPENKGLINARNIGLSQCSTDYLVNLDDDSWFEDETALAKAIEFMDLNPDVAIGAFNIKTDDRDYLWGDNARQPFVVPFYVGCGHIIRSRIVFPQFLYVPEFVRQGEEKDRALRLFDHGFRCVGLPAVRVCHAVSSLNRDRGRANRYEISNDIKRELLRAPALLVILGLFKTVVGHMRRHGAREVRGAVRALWAERRHVLRLVIQRRRAVRCSSYLWWHWFASCYSRKYGIS